MEVEGKRGEARAAHTMQSSGRRIGCLGLVLGDMALKEDNLYYQ